MVALDATTGAEWWRVSNEGNDEWWPSLLLANGILYQHLSWNPQTLPEPLRSAADLVGIDGTAGIRALDASTGAELWRFEGAGEGGVTAAVGNGAVYLLESGEGGTLTALADAA